MKYFASTVVVALACASPALAIGRPISVEKCGCYTATQYVTKGGCEKATSTCIVPMCLFLSTTTIPGPNKRCPTTPTTTSVVPCETTCHKGCGTWTTTETATVPCLTSTTSSPVPTLLERSTDASSSNGGTTTCMTNPWDSVSSSTITPKPSSTDAGTTTCISNPWGSSSSSSPTYTPTPCYVYAATPICPTGMSCAPLSSCISGQVCSGTCKGVPAPTISPSPTQSCPTTTATVSNLACSKFTKICMTPMCVILKTTTVPPKGLCTTTPTMTVTAPCQTACTGGCKTVWETVTASLLKV